MVDWGTCMKACWFLELVPRILECLLWKYFVALYIVSLNGILRIKCTYISMIALFLNLVFCSLFTDLKSWGSIGVLHIWWTCQLFIGKSFKYFSCRIILWSSSFKRISNVGKSSLPFFSYVVRIGISHIFLLFVSRLSVDTYPLYSHFLDEFCIAPTYYVLINTYCTLFFLYIDSVYRYFTL